MTLSARAAALSLLTLGLAAGLAVPFIACAGDSGNPVVSSAARASYALGSLVCHQRPERSFFSCGRKWPVCGRCAGIYMGFALGGLLVLAGSRSRVDSSNEFVGQDTRFWRRALILAALPTAALWLLEFVGGVNPGSLVRWAGAVPLGAATAGWLGAVARGDLR
jgi:hypothetical protein